MSGDGRGAGAHLNGANLSTAHLNGRRSARRRSAHLRGADLKVADLRYADLRGALIFQSELAEACTADQDAREPAEAKLPPGLTLRQCDFSPSDGGEF